MIHMSDAIISLIADGLVVPIVLIGAGVLLVLIPNKDKYQAYCRMLLAGLTAYASAKIIGYLYQPEVMRPFEKLGIDPGASFLNNPGFPSDHVLFSMVITLAVLFGAKRKKLAAVLFILTLAVGVGRVLALVHTPLDVIGALLIACIGIPWYFVREGNGARATAVKKSTVHPRIKSKKSVK